MAPVERRTHNTVKTMVISLKNLFTAPTSNQVVDVAPAFAQRILWIPLKGKYLYENDSNNVGTIYNYCMHACAFGLHPSLSTSVHLAQISVTSEFFFKDPLDHFVIASLCELRAQPETIMARRGA